jgi:phytoene dehydrogenase-like protein
MSKYEYDAVVVGSGPNGLAAAIALALSGCSVAVFEGRQTIGGGVRSAEITLPGFIHDICSAIHPLALGSPFFRRLPLSNYGLEWIQPAALLAHPFDDGSAALLERSISESVKTLGAEDHAAYADLFEYFVENWDKIEDVVLGPFQIPKHPLIVGRFALDAFVPASSLAKRKFQGEKAKGLFAGMAAHSIQPLDRILTSGFGLLLGILGHVYGWPMPRGGSQKIADALAGYLKFLGGKIFTNTEVKSIDELPPSRAIMLDVTPQQAIKLAGHILPNGYIKKLKKYRYGPGVFKIDWALEAPIPWKAKECLRAGSIHLGNTLEEIAAGEKGIWEGKHASKPFILAAQQSLFDPTRAPPGKHTAWAYCHVPHNSSKDMTFEIEEQMERFAPGFRDIILAKTVRCAMNFESYNPNCIGGDITGGVQDIWQVFSRPAGLFDPYATPVFGLYFCSSSTPPGGGVHGMCGFHAACSALSKVFGIDFDLNKINKEAR